MGIEIERKFLVDQEKWQAAYKPVGQNIKQGYIINDDNKTMRLRLTDDTAWFTFKTGAGAISKNEYEYEIPNNEAADLFKQFVKTGLEKKRYCITYAGKLWEVDVFEGDNEGLIVAEIELDSEDEQFELPPWVAGEVSHDARYYNAALSAKPFKTW